MSGQWVVPADAVTPAVTRQRYLAEGLWDDTTLAGRVRHHGSAMPDAIAVVDDAGSYSFGRLCSDAAGFAASLSELGVEHGTVVSAQLPNRYEFAVVAVAVQSLGAVINPLLPNYRARELGAVFSTAGPRVIVTPAEYRGFDHRVLVPEVAEATGVRPHHVVVGGDAGPGATGYAQLARASNAPLRGGRPEAVSELIFTSGTEARPKAIMHTEQTANFSVRIAHDDLGLSEDDVVWMPSPTRTLDGLQLWAALRPLPRSSTRPAGPVERRGGGRIWSGTKRAPTPWPRPPSSKTWWRRPSRGGVPLGSLRFFGCGGAAVPPAPGRCGRGARRPGPTPVRVHRGAGGDLEPTEPRASSIADTPTGRP